MAAAGRTFVECGGQVPLTLGRVASCVGSIDPIFRLRPASRRGL